MCLAPATRMAIQWTETPGMSEAIQTVSLDLFRDSRSRLHRAPDQRRGRKGAAVSAATAKLRHDVREYGIVPWPEHSAYTAAADCFRAWLHERCGSQAAEVRELIARVRRFIEAHGLSRLQLLESDLLAQHPIANRAGFRRARHRSTSSGSRSSWRRTRRKQRC
jgi:hypothetical protein